MGLAERKTVAAVIENEYKTFQSKVKTLCGFDVKMTFDWTKVENHPDCMWICENKKYESFMFTPIADALSKICADEIGTKAIKAGLKEINMIPMAGNLEFTGGVLTIRNDLTGDGAYGADSIQDVLEKSL